VALAAGRNVRLLKEQIDCFKPRLACVVDAEHAAELESLIGRARHTEIVYGEEGYRLAAQAPESRMVLSAMVGAAGLTPTLAAIEAGKDIALANKETLVVAGQLVMELARARGVNILPVDSEHGAVFQCLQGHRRQDVKRILLTASGGPFWRWSREDMEKARPAEALKHPNWSMGSKISIDSATMMNKGLEIIEAHWLFGMPYEQISVLVHPQSVVHSLVEYVDGSVIAQLGQPT
jgi:1-deoxy-D-xylulose-5-phosphate reductoisomerase